MRVYVLPVLTDVSPPIWLRLGLTYTRRPVYESNLSRSQRKSDSISLRVVECRIEELHLVKLLCQWSRRVHSEHYPRKSSVISLLHLLEPLQRLIHPTASHQPLKFSIPPAMAYTLLIRNVISQLDPTIDTTIS